MIIDEKKREAIELIVSGEHNKTDIAKIVGISRTTLYEWLKDKEFMAEANRRTQEIKAQAERKFNGKLDIAIDEYWKLAMSKNDFRTKEKALSYWINRSLGNTTTKHQMIETEEDNSNINEEIEALLNKSRNRDKDLESV